MAEQAESDPLMMPTRLARCEVVMDRFSDLLDAAADGLAGDLDEDQIELYDLALCSAELAAARRMLDYAAQDGADGALRQALAGVFAADAAHKILGRLLRAPDAYGLMASDVAGAVPSIADLGTQHLGVGALTRAFDLLSTHQGRLPDDGLPHDVRLMRDTFARFSDEQVAPVAADVHRSDALVPAHIVEGLRELGCFGLSVPQRFGGLKPDDTDDSLGMVVVTEELSRGSLGAAGSLITRPEIVARALLEGGTTDQQARWLPGIAAGRPLCAVSVTEPGAGSDVAAVGLRATPAARGWRLDGGKTWCTFAGKAGVILVLARTDADARPAHRGLSLFMVEKPEFGGHDFMVRQPGGGRLTGRSIATIGYRGMHSFELFFDGFVVPDDALIGGEAGLGKGFYYTMRGFMGGRLQTAARAAGLMRAAYDAAWTYAADRCVFGKPVAEFALTRAKLVKMAAHIVSVQQLTYDVARLIDAGNGQTEASLVKLFACRGAEWVCREAMQIHGGIGYAEDTAVSRYFVDARVLSIFEGAEETLAIRVIGKALLEKATARRASGH